MDPSEANLKLMEAAMLVSNPSATQEDADKAVAIFNALLAEGHSGAMFGLADLKTSGRWIPQDIDGAIDLYAKAADEGNVPAMFRLGNIYMQDKKHFEPKKALLYLNSCADARSPLAYGCLGDMYYYGIGLDGDPVRAADYYMRAAGQGIVSQCSNLDACTRLEGVSRRTRIALRPCSSVRPREGSPKRSSR